MFQFPAFAPHSVVIPLQGIGLPHSDIRGSTGVCPSPRLFAACHVLLRLREPRHPPYALTCISRLEFQIVKVFTSPAEAGDVPSARHARTCVLTCSRLLCTFDFWTDLPVSSSLCLSYVLFPNMSKSSRAPLLGDAMWTAGLSAPPARYRLDRRRQLERASSSTSFFRYLEYL